MHRYIHIHTYMHTHTHKHYRQKSMQPNVSIPEESVFFPQN